MADEGDNNVFVYMGGDQEVPRDVTHVRVHKSVKIITARAFLDRRNLVSLEMHDGVEMIGEQAFWGCRSLRGVKLIGVRVIGDSAFFECEALEDVEFGDKLVTIGGYAFTTTSLRSVKIPKVRHIEEGAFHGCQQLTEVKLSKDLETIGHLAFCDCPRLRRVALPLKENMFENMFDEDDDDFDVFHNCVELSQVDLVGGIHRTISSLLVESLRHEMKEEIDSINQALPNTHSFDKTTAIRQWMKRVLERMEHYKSEHYTLLKKNMVQLELALWDANLPNVNAEASRHEARVTCGANIIIPHVLSFLNDADEFPLLDCERLAELRDDKLFTPPDESHWGECPICCLPLPLDIKKSEMNSCCGKTICIGCSHATKKRELELGMEHKCPCCLEPIPKTQEEVDQNTMERVKVNEPVALLQMGIKRHKEGDYEGAIQYYTKAAELGEMTAHFNLSLMYHRGEGVEKDAKKEVYHLEEAAIGGDPTARHNLAVYEEGSGRHDRAVKHFIIAASLGFDISLQAVKNCFRRGLASKEDFEAALRGHQAAVDATKSTQREEANNYFFNMSN